MWCRKCSGVREATNGPKLMNRCKPAKMDTKENGKMLKRIQILGEEMCQRRIRESGKLRGQKDELQGKSAQGFGKSLRLEVLWLKKGRWNIAKRKLLEDRGALPRKDGDLLREYQAMHEECKFFQF